MSLRASILVAGILCGFALVVLRLGDLMLLEHQGLMRRAEGQQNAEQQIDPMRGKILDRMGRELAVNVDVVSLFANPMQIDPQDHDRAASEIARLTGLSTDEAAKKLRSERGFVWLKRKLPPAFAATVDTKRDPWLGMITEHERVYPKGELASHVIGFVGYDNKGVEGIEHRYDKYLAGHAEKVEVARDSGGNTLSDGVEYESVGSDVHLTIDEGLQYIAQTEIKKARETWQAASVSAVMMDPMTGEILALANDPEFDLNAPGKTDADNRRNRALTDPYEPGSTFKVVTSSCALEEGVVTPDTHFDCSRGSITVGGHTIKDVHRMGYMSVSQIIQKSSNVGTIQIGMKVGKQRLYKYIKAYGFGSPTGVDLPAESGGLVLPLKNWSDVSLASSSIGYGISVTPLQILRAYSVVANGGYLVKPHVVDSIVSQDGIEQYKFAQGELKRVISARTAATMKQILTSVTQKGGTAEGAEIDGNDVAGKTGTAKLFDTKLHRYSENKYVGSFVGFVPVSDPKIALIVVVFEPKGRIYGGLVAAPTFKSIADQTLSYLNVPRDDDFKNNTLMVQGRPAAAAAGQ